MPIALGSGVPADNNSLCSTGHRHGWGVATGVLRMRANTEEEDFTTLAEQFRELVKVLLDTVNMPAMGLDAEPAAGGNFRGFDAGQFYVVRSGTIAARYQ